MPRYHLNVFNAHGDAPDEEGAHYPDLAAARRQAIQGVRALLSAEVLDGEINLIGHLDIVDESGLLVDTINFADVVRIVR